MKKMVFVLLITILISLNNVAYAGYTFDIKGNKVLTQDSYTTDGKIKVYLNEVWTENITIDAELDKLNNRIPKFTFRGADDKIITGVIVYPNITDAKVGLFDLQWTFTPNDNITYETISGNLHFNIFPADTEESKGKLPDEDTKTPTLTASTLMLASTNSSYDINIDNKPESGSTYKWTSSNEKVAKVNSKGVVTPVSEGEATITCTITNTKGNETKLKSKVVIGQDDNFPTLNDDNITLDVGDTYKLKVENREADSTVKFISSDKNIAKVSTTSGKITGVAQGEVIITCVITNSDKSIVVLNANITIEY